MAVAAPVRTSMPDESVIVSWVYCTLGNAYQKLGNFSKAIEYQKEHLTWQRRLATGRGRAARTRTLATLIIRRGTMPRPSSTTCSTWRLQRREPRQRV